MDVVRYCILIELWREFYNKKFNQLNTLLRDGKLITFLYPSYNYSHTPSSLIECKRY